MKVRKKEIIEKILEGSDLFTKDQLNEMGMGQLTRLADYLIKDKSQIIERGE